VNEGLKKLRRKKINFAQIEEIDSGRVVDEDKTDESLRSIKEGEQKYYINLVLEKLSPRDSLILRLFYLEERDISEVAKIMEMSKTNIKTVLHRSRKRFYSVLERELKYEMKSLL